MESANPLDLREGWKWKSFFLCLGFLTEAKKRLQRTARPERLQWFGEGHAQKIVSSKRRDETPMTKICHTSQ
jgi:hypothetical protein